MKIGRIVPCQQKGKCRRPKRVTFGAVEAYLSRKGDLDAASSTIRQCMSTADAIVQRHSVTYEFDFLDQYSAARRACTMSWDVASSSLGLGGYDGFPSFQQCNPDEDQEGGFGIIEWKDQFLHPIVAQTGTSLQEQQHDAHLCADPAVMIDIDNGQVMNVLEDGDSVRILLPERVVSSHRLLDDRPTTRPETRSDSSEEQTPDITPEDEGHTDFYPHHDWIALFQEDDDQDESRSRFTIYGLAEESRGTREAIVRQPTPVSVSRAVRQQFPEFRQWHLRIHMVHPQPSDDASSTHVLAEFTQAGARMNPLLIPVVDDLQQFDPYARIYAHRFATYRMSPTTYDLLLHPHWHQCPMDGQQHCLIWCRELPLTQGRQATLHRGDLITIRILPHGSSLTPSPALGNVEQLYEHIVDVVQANQLSSLHLYFHTVDGQSSTFSISEFHPGILNDLCAHAQFLWGSDAAIRLGTFTSSSPHNVHFVIGSQTMDVCLALVAVSTTNAEGHLLCAFRAVILPLWCSVTDLSAQLGLSWVTDRFRDLVYNADTWHGGPLQLQEHSFFEVTIPVEVFMPFMDNVFEDDSETDASSLMQSSSSRGPTTSLVTITLRGMHRRLHTFELPLGQSLFEYLDQNWPFQALSHSDMVALHVVDSPPSYVNRATEQLYLVECDSDRFDQVHVDDVLILVTIKYFIPGTTWERDKVRTKVAWCPKRASRDGILQYLRMQWFCRQSTITCELFFNEMVWGPTDTLIRHFQSGDHLRLNILSTQEQWCAFEFAEQADRSRFFFESSPSDNQGAQEGQEEDSLSPYSIRERSRSRTRSPSLLQWHAVLKRDSERSSFSTHGLPQKVANPLVLDRWCERQLDVDPCVESEPYPGQQQEAQTEASLHAWNFHPVIRIYESFDANFTLPCYALPEEWQWKGPELQWKDLPIFEPGEFCHEIVIYSDGSEADGKAGAAAVIYCFTDHGWTFGGAVSIHLPQATSFSTEQWGTILATKAFYDILKLQQVNHGRLP